MSLENLEAVTGGIVVSRAKEIYKYLSDEDKKKVEEMEKEMSKGYFFSRESKYMGLSLQAVPALHKAFIYK